VYSALAGSMLDLMFGITSRKTIWISVFRYFVRCNFCI